MTGSFSIRNAAFFLLTAVFLIGTATASSQKTDPKSKATVQDWLAWRVFHESLVVRNDQVPDHLREHVSSEIGLNSKQFSALLLEGPRYLAEIRRIDDEVRAETRIRYSDITMPPRIITEPPTSMVKIDPAEHRKTVPQRMEEDGFAVEVDARKQAALLQHIQRLNDVIASSKVKAIEKYVRTKVAPQIQVHVSTPPSTQSPSKLQVPTPKK